MSVYARVVAGVVVEMFTPPGGFVIGDCFAAAIVAQMVDVTAVTPAPEPGWTASLSGSTWTFAAPVVPTPTTAQQAAALLGAGLTITSTGTPALNGTYPTDPATQLKLMGVQLTVTATGNFPGGAGVTSWPVKDAGGTWHSCTGAQFLALAGAVAAFVAACMEIVDGHTGTSLPASSATIA